jgi:hypothetical protein
MQSDLLNQLPIGCAESLDKLLLPALATIDSKPISFNQPFAFQANSNTPGGNPDAIKTPLVIAAISHRDPYGESPLRNGDARFHW